MQARTISTLIWNKTIYKVRRTFSFYYFFVIIRKYYIKARRQKNEGVHAVGGGKNDGYGMMTGSSCENIRTMFYIWMGVCMLYVVSL